MHLHRLIPHQTTLANPIPNAYCTFIARSRLQLPLSSQSRSAKITLIIYNHAPCAPAYRAPAAFCSALASPAPIPDRQPQRPAPPHSAAQNHLAAIPSAAAPPKQPAPRARRSQSVFCRHHALIQAVVQIQPRKSLLQNLKFPRRKHRQQQLLLAHHTIAILQFRRR